MAIIVPAILEQTKEGFMQKLSLVMKIPGVERVQVDFGDGVFIPTKLLMPEEMDVLNPAIHWEAHLMVKQPNDFLDYQICGFKTIIVHYEAFESVEDLKKTLNDIRQMGFRTSVAINPDTNVEVLENVDVDQYLIMSVMPGKQGQAFIEATTSRIQELRKLKPNAIIEVDGGVNISTIKKATEADLIVVGSAIVGTNNPAESFEKLKQIIK